MPRRLRPTAPIAPEAILVGDPGRALLLAQELLDEPKMSNHARGLWGYWGKSPAGRALTIQATGIGGPSAALVLGELAELGVRSAIRIGTCVGSAGTCRLGELLIVTGALAAGGSVVPLGAAVGETVSSDSGLTEQLAKALAGEARSAIVASFDADPGGHLPHPGVVAADMQTAPLLARAASLEIEVAAVLIAAEIAGGETVLEQESLESSEKRAGRAAFAVLSA
jgi:uridine phosphorylase